MEEKEDMQKLVEQDPNLRMAYLNVLLKKNLTENPEDTLDVLKRILPEDMKREIAQRALNKPINTDGDPG